MSAVRPCIVVLLALAPACVSSSKPVPVTSADTCAHCRMAVSDARVAGQIAAPGEDPLFYDDIGCLANAVKAGTSIEFAYVADHRTGAWVRATAAVYTHVPSLATPMGSSLMAHADDASRRADSAAAAGRAMTHAEVFSKAAPGAPDGG